MSKIPYCEDCGDWAEILSQNGLCEDCEDQHHNSNEKTYARESHNKSPFYNRGQRD